MLQKIQNSEKFVSEYKDFQRRILEVTDQSLQSELTKNLLAIKEAVSMIDRHHENMMTGMPLPGDMKDLREKIASSRKFILSKLPTTDSKKS